MHVPQVAQDEEVGNMGLIDKLKGWSAVGK